MPFWQPFEFSNFSSIKRHQRSNILTDLCPTPNLAMETTCFIPDLQKKSSDMPNPRDTRLMLPHHVPLKECAVNNSAAHLEIEMTIL